MLNAVVDVLNKNPNIQLEVQGHTDNKGAAGYNKDLSNRRAHSVMKYLTGHGITPGRLTAVGYGLERPLIDNSTEANRALNRRFNSCVPRLRKRVALRRAASNRAESRLNEMFEQSRRRES